MMRMAVMPAAVGHVEHHLAHRGPEVEVLVGVDVPGAEPGAA